MHELNCKESDFTATRPENAKDKMRFAKQFCKFVMRGFLLKDFPNWFYVRLSMTFGHIAHYNQGGFYDYFFQDVNGKIKFIRRSLLHECYGSPEHTYSDVEKILKKWLEDNQVLEQLHLEANKSRVASERCCLSQLIKKYAETPSVAEAALKLLDFPV